MADDIYPLNMTGARIQGLLDFLDSLEERGSYYKEYITSDTSPDDLTDNGWYYIQKEHLIDPDLVNTGGYIFNARGGASGNMQTQIFVSSSIPRLIQYRLRVSSGDWTSWETLALSSRVEEVWSEAKRNKNLEADAPVIPEGDNVNTYVTPGVYRVPTNSEANRINMLPEIINSQGVRVTVGGGRLYVLVTAGVGKITQIYLTSVSSTDASGDGFYYRTGSSSDSGMIWTDWKSILAGALASDMFGTSGAKLTGTAAIPVELNELVTPGVYRIENASDISESGEIKIKDTPATIAGKLVVMDAGSFNKKIQIYYPSLTSSGTGGALYTRYGTKVEGVYTWSDWVNLYLPALLNDIFVARESTRVAQDTDFNSLNTAGTYIIWNTNDAKTMRNIPNTSSGKLFVFDIIPGRTCQVYVTNSNENQIYHRRYGTTGWSEWINVSEGYRTFVDRGIPENTIKSRILNNAVSSVEINLPVLLANKLPRNTDTLYNKDESGTKLPDSIIYFAQDYKLPGITYSSVWRDGQDALWNMSLECYYSALANPTSVMYTKDYTDVGVKNGHTWYGVVCSTFISKMLNREYPETTRFLNTRFVEKEDQGIDILEVGDVLCRDATEESSGHIAIVSNIFTDELGVIKTYAITEAAGNSIRTREYDRRGLLKRIEDSGDIIKTSGVSMFWRPEPVEWADDVFFEYGNDAYWLLSDAFAGHMWFYIPKYDNDSISNPSYIYIKKPNGSVVSVNIANTETPFGSKTINGHRVWDLSACFATNRAEPERNIGDYAVTTHNPNDPDDPIEFETCKKCVIHIISTGSIQRTGNVWTFDGYKNCVPAYVGVIRIYEFDPESESPGDGIAYDLGEIDGHMYSGNSYIIRVTHPDESFDDFGSQWYPVTDTPTGKQFDWDNARPEGIEAEDWVLPSAFKLRIAYETGHGWKQIFTENYGLGIGG